MVFKLEIPGTELFDEETQEFISLRPTTLQLEHSLIAISRWESKWKKPFLVDQVKTREETLDYFSCMSLSTSVDELAFQNLTQEQFQQIQEYILDPMTATTFSESGLSKKTSEQVTSELIYYWMTTYNIPFEAQKWHINRLLTLIRVCTVKNSPEKKMSPRAAASMQRELNEKRRKALGTKG